MAYFRCGVAPGHGGDGADLIVTCSQNFAGKTITCTDGNKTYTQQCPSSSPYEVTFESIPTGTWTISGVISGQTFSTTKTITDFTALLADIPEGSTATPTDVIQTWLHCANIWDKNYTTINQVLSDSTTLLALISSNNAVDYMVRSTSWASSVCANSTAMTYIGANDYCANKLLANSTWCNAICNSTYFESVLNVKVPTMTSNTTPSGEVIYSYAHPSQAVNNYKAFDSNAADGAVFTCNIGYKFTSKVAVRKIKFDEYFYLTSQMPSNPGTIYFDGSNDNNTWTRITTVNVTPSWQSWVRNQGASFVNDTKYQYYRIRIASAPLNDSTYVQWDNVQFYGRA